MTWIQDSDALVGKSGPATYKIYNRVNYRCPVLTPTEARSRGELSIIYIAPGWHYCVAKVDTDEEGQRFSEWHARAMNYE
jgi:hypothetical protein